MHTTYVENITAFISNMRPSKQEESKPVGPVPIITIDGIDYYRVHTLNIVEEAKKIGATGVAYFALANLENTTASNDILTVRISTSSGTIVGRVITIGDTQIYPQPNDYGNILYLTEFVDGCRLLDTYYKVGPNTPVNTYDSLAETGITSIYLIYDEANDILTVYDNKQ